MDHATQPVVAGPMFPLIPSNNKDETITPKEPLNSSNANNNNKPKSQPGTPTKQQKQPTTPNSTPKKKKRPGMGGFDLNHDDDANYVEIPKKANNEKEEEELLTDHQKEARQQLKRKSPAVVTFSALDPSQALSQEDQPTSIPMLKKPEHTKSSGSAISFKLFPTEEKSKQATETKEETNNGATIEGKQTSALPQKKLLFPDPPATKMNSAITEEVPPPQKKQKVIATTEQQHGSGDEHNPRDEGEEKDETNQQASNQPSNSLSLSAPLPTNNHNNPTREPIVLQKSKSDPSITDDILKMFTSPNDPRAQSKEIPTVASMIPTNPLEMNVQSMMMELAMFEKALPTLSSKNLLDAQSQFCLLASKCSDILKGRLIGL